MSYPLVAQPSLPPNTVVPQDQLLFIPYLNRVYEDIAFTVNSKDSASFITSLGSAPQNIPNVPNYGSYILLVSAVGADADGISYVPSISVALSKSSPTVAGVFNVLTTQAGTGTWAGINLSISATVSNFQITHNRAGVRGNFSFRVLKSL